MTTIGELCDALDGHDSDIEVRLIDPAVGDVPLDNIDFEDGDGGRVVLLSSDGPGRTG